MENNCQYPFKIFVIWDEEFNRGYQYAESIFETYSGAEDDYTGERICIPVRFINDPLYDIKKEIDNCKYAAVVLFVDNKLLINKNSWYNLIHEVLVHDNGRIRLYPVAFVDSRSISNSKIGLEKKNHITLTNIKIDLNETRIEKEINYIKFELAHEFSRLLFDHNRISESVNTEPTGIRIFISHACVDGKEYAQDFNRYLSCNTSLDRFIDAYDIYKGDDFEKDINKNIESSALLILYTDSYSSREWCQHEVLYAKEKGRPILLVDLLRVGEKRRFPYMANIRTIHIGDDDISDDKKEKIVFNILLETIRVKYIKLYLEYLCTSFKIKDTRIFTYPPELLTVLTEKSINHRIKRILYSEPPLNKRELKMLNRVLPNIQFVTPTLLLNYDIHINNILVGLSVSEISDSSNCSNAQLKILTIELIRYLLSVGARIIYGGSFAVKTKINYLDLLYNLVQSYSDKSKNHLIHNYYIKDYPVSDEDLVKAGDLLLFKEVKTEKDNLQDRLTDLRTEINNECDARIVIGGKTKDYSGKMPGVIEETLIAYNTKKPLFILGSYGGAAKLIAESILGSDTEIDYREMLKPFKDKGISCLNNGLSDEDNTKLLHSDDVVECVSLIIKGLNSLYKTE